MLVDYSREAFEAPLICPVFERVFEPALEKFSNRLSFGRDGKPMRLIGTSFEQFVSYLGGCRCIKVPSFTLAVFPTQIERADPPPVLPLEDGAFLCSSPPVRHLTLFPRRSANAHLRQRCWTGSFLRSADSFVLMTS